MKILALVTDAYGGKGGIAQYNRDVLDALCKHQDCEEIIAIPRAIEMPCSELPDKLTFIKSAAGSKIKYIYTVLKTVLQSKNIDLVICGHINLIPLALIIRYFFNTPVLLVIYGIDAWQPTPNYFANQLAKKIDGLASISDITLQRFLSWNKINSDKLFLLPNAIHLEQYGIKEKSAALLDHYGVRNKKVLLTLGRLVSEERAKGFDEIIELLPELIQKIPDLVYMIAGEGGNKQRLINKVNNLGISNRVIFTGYIDDETKADHYRLADVYVMPSRGEGFGFVFLEAMACGIPAIASTADGGCEALRNGELGLLVDPDNPEQIKNAILESLEKNREIPTGLEYFSFDNFSKRLYGIIDAMLTKSRQKI